MKRKTKILLASYLSVAILTLALYAWAGQWGLGWYRRTANESASLAFEETVRSVERLSGVLDKSVYATDSDMCDRICCEAYACAAAAESAMSTLPFSTWELEQLSAFLNTAGDYAYSLCGRGEPFSGEQREDLKAMAATAADFSHRLLELREGLNGRELSMDSREKRLRNVGGENEVKLSGELLAYEKDFTSPELRYDGKYGGEPEKKSGGLLTEREMLSAAADFAGVAPEELQMEYQFEGTEGRRCYRAGDRFLSVGRAGVESMSCDRIVYEEKLSAQEALQAAEDFLQARGYGELQLLEQSQSGCIAQFRFVREQDGALCPDSALRLAIALDDGSLYSFDAADFDPEPVETHWTVDEETARAALPEDLSVTESGRVLLRSPGGRALPCYVFSGADAEGRQVEICVSAETGKQVRINVGPRIGV